MVDFLDLIDGISRRPAMYVGRVSLRAASHYLHGYDHASEDAGFAPRPLEGWMRWVELRFLISHSAWHWTRILLHHYGTEEAAFATLPVLYREFLSDRARLTVDGIEAELRRSLLDAYGRDWHEPVSTKTTFER
jgi:hypothetical protein